MLRNPGNAVQDSRDILSSKFKFKHMKHIPSLACKYVKKF